MLPTNASQNRRHSLEPAVSAELLRQEQRFARAVQVLRDAIQERAFPGAAFSVLWRDELVAVSGVGGFTYEPDSPRVKGETIYDLASVSKVMATTPMAMILYDRGQLDLDSVVVSVIPEFAGNQGENADLRRARVTVRMLLAHSSGLPAYVRLFERCQGREELLHAAFTTPLEADPGTRAEYSDIGFMVLGELLSQIAGETLDTFCQREVFRELQMLHTLFRPAEQMCHTFPPTVEDREYRRRTIQGEVHDENASALGGVAGHAGMFANAGDVARFAHCMLNGGMPIVRPETVALFTRRESSSPGTSRALGWDTPSSPSQSGKYFSARAFGHLGYTGTSLWIDPERQLAITLLTNRTWPDRKSQAIKRVRPLFHDAVVEAL
jgi:serine-type D-Ala-D-Ala carboxypeptidase